MSCEREMSVWSIEVRANLVKGIVVACKDSWEKLKTFHGRERFHSRDQHLCKFNGTKESVYIRKPLFDCFGTPIWPP